jgi:hypothetical protein
MWESYAATTNFTRNSPAPFFHKIKGGLEIGKSTFKRPL